MLTIIKKLFHQRIHCFDNYLCKQTYSFVFFVYFALVDDNERNHLLYLCNHKEQRVELKYHEILSDTNLTIVDQVIVLGAPVGSH